MRNNYHGVKNAEVWELNVVSQKLLSHSFVLHSFIPNSLSLVNISEIKLLALK